MLGVSRGFAAYLGSGGIFLVEDPLGGAEAPLGVEGRPLEGGGEEVGGCVEGDFEALRAGQTRGGGRGGGVSSEGGKEAGDLLLNPPMYGRGVLGTGGGTSEVSPDNVGEPWRAECDAGREEQGGGVLIVG